jgi:hypothetical protein
MNLEDVPKQVQKFLDESVRELTLTSSDLMDVKIEGPPQKVLEGIDEIRQRLALIDSRLEDCYMGYSGYHRMILEQHAPEETPEAPYEAQLPHGASNIDPSEIEHLRSELQALRENEPTVLQGGEK